MLIKIRYPNTVTVMIFFFYELLTSLKSILEHVYIPSNYHQDSKEGPEAIRLCRNY